MPWKEQDTMSLRREFVRMAMHEGSNVRALCRRFGISPATGYKWLCRFREEGVDGLRDRSRRPHHSPNRTSPQVEAAVLAVREKHPVWCGRKIRRVLQKRGHREVPAASTITEILRRHGKLSPPQRAQRDLLRFEAEAPNDLWQMDFKGDFALRAGRCYPLTVLDDHSRFSVALRACPNQQRETVRSELIPVFDRFGLPYAMLMDNGPPWGAMGEKGLTRLSVWLIRLGIRVVHSRPYHPQTLGKDERFHRTLKAEVLKRYDLRDLPECQRRFDPWRDAYNFERPHDALGLDVPVSRYRASPRSFPRELPPIEHGPDDEIRKVIGGGRISFRGRLWRISRALIGEPVALRPTAEDGVFEVFYCHHRVTRLNLDDA